MPLTDHYKSPRRRRRNRPESHYRGKLWKQSIGVDRRGIPLGCTIDSASRTEVRRQLITAGLTITSYNAFDEPAIEVDHRRLRSIVEATNSWLSNYGQVRCNTDRKACHRCAAPASPPPC